MAEYIEREAISKVLNDNILNDPNCPLFVASTVQQVIDCQPAADVEPVRHGAWEKVLQRLAAYEDIGMELEEIRELSQAKKEGRLVVLPCKTGDTIYQLRGKKHALGIGVSPRIVSCALVWSDGDYSLKHQGMDECAKKDLGKTWFLTREEAEAALKGDTDNA